MRVACRLAENGHVAYFAGGCVRDRLLGIEPEDYDVATDALPEGVREIFPHARGVGAAFGVVLVGSGGRTIEVATFRSDGTYADSRHPVEVTFGSAEEDALRRDFTINGLFEDPETGTVIDLVGGQADLDERILRAIGDPEARFEEDHLRMLRAVRFSARFELTIDQATSDAISTRAARLEGISRERIGQELRRMFTDPNRAVAAELIEGFGLDVPILGMDVGSARGITRMAALPKSASWIDGLVSWVLDRATEVEPRALADTLSKRLVLSNQEREEFFEILDIRRQLRSNWGEMGIATRKRLVARPRTARALGIVATEDPEGEAQLAKEIEPLLAEGVAPTPFINGGDLLEAGFQEGPQLGAILESVYDAQLEGRLKSREEAMDLARGLAS